MKIDDQDLFSDAQAITASAKSTHLIDLKAAAGRAIAVGGPQLFLVAQVVEAFTDATSDSTVTVAVESDDNEAMASPVSRQVIGTFAALSPVGTRLTVPLTDKIAPERYIRVDYTVANGSLSTGKITTWITADPQQWQAYPQGSTGPTFS